MTTDLWNMPAPTDVGLLPGGVMEMSLWPRNVDLFRHEQMRVLHAAVTAGLDIHHSGNTPTLSLMPWPRRSGVSVYIHDTATANAASNRSFESRIHSQPVTIGFSRLVRFSRPVVAAKAHVVKLTTLTPVVMRSMGGKVFRTEPTAENFEHSLSGDFAARMCASVSAEDIAVDIIESHTTVERVSLQGKQGQVMGWAGTLTLLCNAPARWLLGCAANGIGLGGRVGFGFGRIHLEDM